MENSHIGPSNFVPKNIEQEEINNENMEHNERGPVNYNPNDINAVLGVMNNKLDNIQNQLKSVNEKLDSHNQRLSALENFRYLLMGAVAVISALTTYIISKFKGLN